MSKIRGLTVFALAALATTLSGCIIESSSSCGAGAVQAEWTVTASGSAVSCAQVGATEVDINVNDMSAPFNCTDVSGVTPAVTGGVSHAVSLTLLDSSNNVLSQTQTMSLFVPCNRTVDIGNVFLSVN
jgi:hypothetical protein